MSPTTLDTTPHSAPTSATPTSTRQTSRLQAARIAGVSYVAIFLLAVFANFIVIDGMIDSDDAAATVANIAGSTGMFRLGIVAFLVVFLLDVVIAWALHIVFRPVHRDLSLVTAWFRLVYTVFLGAGLVYLLEALQIVTSETFGDAFGPEQVAAQAAAALQSFDNMWLIGLAAFGVHLVLVGILALRSGLVPTALPVLLITAGIAYIVDTVAHVVLPNYATVATIFLAIVAIPSVVGEGWLGLWLLRTRKLTGTAA